MGARTGAEYLARLREAGAEVWLHGERVEDVTSHPAMRNVARSIAALFDMQHAYKDEMTYPSPVTGDPVGLSFLQPRSRNDLVRRRRMMRRWASTVTTNRARSILRLGCAIRALLRIR